MELEAYYGSLPVALSILELQPQGLFSLRYANGAMARLVGVSRQEMSKDEIASLFLSLIHI